MKTPSTVLTVCMLLQLESAHAAFVGGVEQFSGTTLDMTTWAQFYNYGGSGVSQNNGLILDATDGTYERGYDTISLQVGVGGSVSAHITLNQVVIGYSTANYFGLYLGTETSTVINAFDTAAIGVECDEVNNVIDAEMFHNGGGLGLALLHHAQPIGTTYTYEIDRISSTAALFQITDNVGAVASQVLSLSSTPDNLYIELVVTPSVKATFNDVTVIPEPPGAIFIFLGLGIVAIGRRVLTQREPVSNVSK